MEPIRSSGRLILFGGLGPRPWGDDAALGGLVARSGDPLRDRVVLLSVGAGVRDDAASEALGRLSVVDVRAFGVARRGDADRAHALAVVERATSVVLSGDDPELVARLLAGTRLDATLRRRLDRPMVLAAVGPAAWAMGEWMLVEGTEEAEDGIGAVVVAGLGYLPRAILDPRFALDGRLDRLRPAVAERPEALGIGLGGETALVVEGDRFEVRGRGPVAVVVGPAAGSEAAGRTRQILEAGDRFDLNARAPVPPGRGDG